MKCKNCGHEINREINAEGYFTNDWKHTEQLISKKGIFCTKIKKGLNGKEEICGCFYPEPEAEVKTE